MKKRALKKKRIPVLLGLLLVLGLALGAGYGLKVRAEGSGTVKKTVGTDGNTKLGTGDMVIDTTSLDNRRQRLQKHRESEKKDQIDDETRDRHYFRSYVYLGKDTPMKFQVINKEWYANADTYKDNLDVKNALLLDCMSVLGTSVYQENGTTVIDKLNGSHFYSKGLTDTEKNAIIKRNKLTATGDEAVSLMWNLGHGGSDIGKHLMKKGQAYWARDPEFASGGKYQGETVGYIDESGEYKQVNQDEQKTTSKGYSPSLLLNQNKILFSTRVDGYGENGQQDEEFKINNVYNWLYTDGEYKLTLIDDKLQATVTEGKSVTLGSANEGTTLTVPYTIADDTSDTRQTYVSLLVTGKTDNSDAYNEDGTWDDAHSSIVSYQYISTDTNSGTAEFTWDQTWNENYYNGTYHVYLIAEKQSNDYSVDAASDPVELEITNRLSSIDMTFYDPMRGDTNWKQYAASAGTKMVDLIEANKSLLDLQITGVNGTSFSTDGSLKELLSVGCKTEATGAFYLKDHDALADFATKYTMGLGLVINNDKMTDKKNKYSFADKVTINLKIITSDDQTEATVKPITIEAKNNGTVTVWDDKTEKELTNTTDDIHFSFDFTTRKAKILNIISPKRSDKAINLDYASTFDGIIKQLSSETGVPKAKVSVEQLDKGLYKEVEEELKVNWEDSEQNAFKKNCTQGQTFVAWGTINSDTYDADEVNSYVYATVKMAAQQTLKNPAIFLDDSTVNIAGSNTTAFGESGKLKITVPTTSEGDKDDTNATIYYTTDGSEPTAKSGTEYGRDKGIELSEETYDALKKDGEVTITVKAMAVRDDWVDSEVSTAEIIFSAKDKVTVTNATIKGRTEEDATDGQGKNTHIYKIRPATSIELVPEDKSSEGKEYSGWKINTDETITTTENPYKYETKGADTIEATYTNFDAPTVEKGPKDAKVTDGKDASFSVEVTVPEKSQDKYKDIKYQWQVKAAGADDFTDLKDAEGSISGATTAKLELTGVAYSQNGEVYQCLVTYTEIDGKTPKTAAYGTDVKQEASLTVLKDASKLNITTDPKNVSVKEEESASFTVEATPGYDGDQLTYQWQMAKDDKEKFEDIEGATAATYTIESTTEDQTGTQYRCKVTEVDENGAAITWGKDTGDGTLTSEAAELTVTKEILYKVTVENGILDDGSTSGSYKAGTSVTITANVPDGQRFVKWSCDNDKVKLKDTSSETTSFEMPTFDKEDTEFTIKAELASAYGITITKEPENATVSAGKSATFSVEASSDYEMVYEWQADYHNGNGYQKVGKDSSYTIKKVNKELSGTTLKCIISLKENPDTTVTTQEVVLNVDAEDYSVTVNNGSASPDSCKAGDTVTIKADDAEEGKVFKKWKVVKGSVNLEDASSPETSFVMPKSDVELTAEYKEENGIQITSQPESVSTPEGGSASFSVAASSSHELSYQWQEDKGDGNGFQNVGNEESYSISSVSSSLNGARYRCVITAKDDAEVTITSNEALLTVTASTYTIKINNGSASATESVAGQVITVTANDAPEGQEFEKWVVVKGKPNLADATSKETTFTMPAANVELDVKYQKQIGAPTIDKQPESTTVFAGSSTNFKVEASGDELSYQWQLDKGDGNGFQDISGATSATYRVYTEDCSMNGYRYQCLVSNRAGSVTSDAAVLTVTYKITQGAGASWQKNSSNGLTFKGSGAYDKFKSVKVDGERLSGSNYTKSSDPTVITLSASYLQNLTNGTHTLTIVWEDGSAEAEFSIGGTAVSSSSSTASTSSTGSSNKTSSGSSSASTGSSSNKAKTSDTSSSKNTGTTDMPIVSKSKSSTDDKTTKTTGTTNKGTSGNSKIVGTSDTNKSSLLNRYAALISLGVVGGSGIGGGIFVAIRRILRRKAEDELL